MYELPSGDYSPQPYTRPRASVAPRFGVLIAIWLFVALAYGGYRLVASRKPDSGAVAKPSETNRMAAAAIAGWRAQARESATAATEAENNILRAEAEVRQTLGLTTSLVEGKRLHAALAKLEAAHRDLERTRYDIDSLQTLLKGEEKP